MIETNENMNSKLISKEQMLANHILTNNQHVASSVENDLEQAEAFYRLGKIFFDKAELITAEKYFKLSLSHLRPLEHPLFAFKVYGFLVRISSERLDTTSTNYLIEASYSLF